MEVAKPPVRRRHDLELKRQVLTECNRPNASVAAVAMSHGLNANLVHKWRRQTSRAVGLASATARDVFIPVALNSPEPSPPQAPVDIRIELRRGATAVSVTWPVSASAECAAWMRELLR